MFSSFTVFCFIRSCRSSNNFKTFDHTRYPSISKRHFNHWAADVEELIIKTSKCWWRAYKNENVSIGSLLIAVNKFNISEKRSTLATKEANEIRNWTKTFRIDKVFLNIHVSKINNRLNIFVAFTVPWLLQI